MPLEEKLSKLINIGLKVAELILGSVYLGIVSYYTRKTVFDEVIVYGHTKVMSFLTINAGFILPTLLLLVVQLHSRSAENQRKSIFEFLYNVFAVVFLVSTSVALLSFSERLSYDYPGRTAFRASGVMGLMNTALFGASAVLAFIDYNK